MGEKATIARTATLIAYLATISLIRMIYIYGVGYGFCTSMGTES